MAKHNLNDILNGLGGDAIPPDVERMAEDSLPNLAGAVQGLRIGAGQNLEAGSFWAGMIDDVRIYNRAVMP